MKNITLLIASAILLTSCTTVEFVRKDLTPEKRATLRYLPQSKPEGEAKHREKMSERAREFCGGDFEITKEYEAREETGRSSGIGTGIGLGMGRGGLGGGIMLGSGTRDTTMYHFVDVDCK